ncbi:DUF87 domain-containing protein [Candidatus Micrarchaeota archaeon]|nr:DUF87 domain-containing protein [Candidatus Micrarchaeota archaeon]
MADKLEYFKLLFYKPAISSTNWFDFFSKMFSKKTPLVNLSMLLPIRKIDISILKEKNYLNFFLKERDSAKQLNNVIFPMRIEDYTGHYQREISHPCLHLPHILTTKHELLNFLTEEEIQEMHLGVVPLFNNLLGFGHGVDRDLRKRYLFIKNIPKFFEFDLGISPGFYLEEIKPIPKSVSMHSQRPVLESESTKIGVENFDVFRHGLVVGSSGSGKSKFCYIFLKAILQSHLNAKIVILDPHDEFRKMFQDDKIRFNAHFIDFRNSFIEPLSVGREKSPQATQLLVELLLSVMSEKNKYTERVLFYSIHLLSSLEKLSFENLTALLTDSVKRMEFIIATENDELKRFFSTEYNDIYTKNFSEGILPVLNLIGEYKIYLGEHEKVEDLHKLINEHRLVIISFDPNYMGRKMIKFIGGSVIQQLYMMAITEKFSSPIVFLADELPLVSNKTIINILSEARKFNLFFYTSLQYLGQLDKDILDSVITNCFNVFSFKVNRDDAALVSSMMDIMLDDVFSTGYSKVDVEEIKKDMFTKLEARQVIARLYKGMDFLPPVKVRTVEVSKWI